MLLSLDMENYFLRVDWWFLEEALKPRGLGARSSLCSWVAIRMECCWILSRIQEFGFHWSRS